MVLDDEKRKEIFGMQQNNFNDIRVDTGKKIKKIFGNKIRSMEFYDVVEKLDTLVV